MPQDIQFMHELNDRLEALEFHENRQRRNINRINYIDGVNHSIQRGIYPPRLEIERPYGTIYYNYIGGRVYGHTSISELPISVIHRITFRDSEFLSTARHLLPTILCNVWQLTQAEDGFQIMTYECFGCNIDCTTRGTNDNQE
jgi:hypothetical protein